MGIGEIGRESQRTRYTFPTDVSVGSAVSDAAPAPVAGAAQAQVVAAVAAAVTREIEDARENGEVASFMDILDELSRTVPSESMLLAGQMAFLVFREEMRLHLLTLFELTSVRFAGSDDEKTTASEANGKLGEYSKSVLDIVRRASADETFDAKGAFERNATEMLAPLLTLLGLASHFQALIRIQAAVLEFKVKCQEIELKLNRAMRKLAENEREFEEMVADLEAIEARIEEASEEVRSDDGVELALKAAVECRLASAKRELVKLVSGFDARRERRQEETREALEERPIYA